ncbi:MAG: hypothetical protein ACXVB9_20795 [Bdellovibrionota bacterium]
MTNPKYILFIAALSSAVAFADDDHFPAPPAGGPPVAGIPTAGSPPTDCNPAALTKYFADFRFAMRSDLADAVAHSIPQMGLQSPVAGVSCIHKTDAFDSKYNNPPDDTFTLTCLAHSRVKVNDQMEDIFSHILVMKFASNPTCLDPKVFVDFTKGTQCKMPNGLQLFTDGIRNCVSILKQEANSGLKPGGLGAPTAYAIDGSWYAALLQKKPNVGEFIEMDRQIKGSAPTPAVTHRSNTNFGGSTSSSANDECANNPFACSHDAK